MSKKTYSVAYMVPYDFNRRMASGYHGMGGSGTVPVPLCALSLYTIKRFYTLFYTLNAREYGCTVYLTVHPVLYLQAVLLTANRPNACRN